MEAGSSDVAFQGGQQRDRDPDGKLLDSRRNPDGSGTLLVGSNPHGSAVRALLEARPSAPFVFDSNYVPSDLSAAPPSASSAAWEVGWSRLYYVSGVAALSSVHVTVSSDGELLVPERLAVQGVTLTVSGALVGVDDLSVGDGGSASFMPSGHTASNGTAGVYALRTLTVDGRPPSGPASATVVAGDGVTLGVATLSVVHGVLYADGAVLLDATLLNVSSGGSIDGTARSTHGGQAGPGYNGGGSARAGAGQVGGVEVARPGLPVPGRAVDEQDWRAAFDAGHLHDLQAAPCNRVLSHVRTGWRGVERLDRAARVGRFGAAAQRHQGHADGQPRRHAAMPGFCHGSASFAPQSNCHLGALM